MDLNELRARLIDIASELGRAPTQPEFQERTGIGRQRIRTLCGNYTTLLKSAGLEASNAPKITNEIFVVRDIAQHIASHNPPTLLLASPYPKIMSISDIHWPFENQEVIDRFIAAVERNQPDFVVLNGDAFDMYSAAKFPRSHNIFIPKEEEALARQKNEEFWRRVKKACPTAQCFQMLGNHDVRPLKRVLEQVPSIEHWAQAYMRDLFSFDGVTTIHDDRQELKIGNVLILHGYRTKLGDHRDFTRTNCIVGHTHRGGVVFRNSYDPEKNAQSVIWESNNGYAGNPYAKGLAYQPQKIHEWTWGWTEVDPRGPRFVPA